MMKVRYSKDKTECRGEENELSCIRWIFMIILILTMLPTGVLLCCFMTLGGGPAYPPVGLCRDRVETRGRSPGSSRRVDRHWEGALMRNQLEELF